MSSTGVRTARRRRSRVRRTQRKARFYRRLAYALCGALAVMLTLWVVSVTRQGASVPRVTAVNPARDLGERVGSRFTETPEQLLAPIEVREVPLPEVMNADAVWGALGRDPNGHVWIGLSVTEDVLSAYLLRYDPESGAMTPQGDVITRLQQADALRPREGQIEIRSRIAEADDGYLYFTSVDHAGEEPDGSRLPNWGGHLWRVKPGEDRWEHLYTAREGLTAVSTTGHWVYALGFWGHVLYQYDAWTGELKRVDVGAAGGHVSRLILSDLRGHAYVPKVVDPWEAERKGTRPEVPETQAFLVEYNSALRALAETPLEHYVAPGDPALSRGITAVTYMANGTMLFTTHPGHLYRIVPPERGGAAAKVEPVGWFHPEGPAEVAGLFTWSGKRHVAGVARRDGGAWQWVVYDLRDAEAQVVDLPIGACPDAELAGSVTRDDWGRFYVGGRCTEDDGTRRPLLLQIEAGG